jgi:aspartyl-tRNA(Asn)/glutamyl-tRNA(Gln) amidotransferase subunit B
MQWETVIGLEVHVQLKTKSKIFSGASTTFGEEPNVNACAVDLAMPGMLPVLNKEVVRMAVKLGTAVNAEICKRSVFARKNYFYPDLPKGYQISQYELPIVKNGFLDVEMGNHKEGSNIKRIGVTRAHLEEDAGKSLHEDFKNKSGIDLNRAGVGLLEIVSEPDMRSAKEAIAYLKTLHTLVCYLDICDGNMQEGSFRCDANVSVRPVGQEKFGTRAEIKNVNSFRSVERAINYEVERQIQLIQSGGKVIQETRLYDAARNETRSMRSKEEAQDYRYFPDPDLLPLIIDDTFINDIKKTLPELPQQKLERFKTDYQLSTYDAGVLISDIELSLYFENVLQQGKIEPKSAANWISGELLGALNKENLSITETKVSSTQLANLLQRISDHTISGKTAKDVFVAMWQGEGSADEIIEKKALKQMTDSSEVEKMIRDVIEKFPTQAAEYRAGKDKLFGFFVGEVMKATKGKANPQQTNEMLKKLLAG